MQEEVRIEEEKLLSKERFTLKKITYSFLTRAGKWQQKKSEVYDVGNAATVLLYNRQQKTIILGTQLRLPSYLNGQPGGKLLETPAGKLDNDTPEKAMIREIEEETGYRVPSVKKILEAYTSPAAVTELIYFFTAEYTPDMKVSEGGGLKEEGEDIDVQEIPFEEAVALLKRGEIRDAKTLILLQYALLNNLIG